MRATVLAIATALFATPALPDSSPTALFGLSYAFGSGTGGLGFTAKLLSSNDQRKSLLAGGITYYPWAGQKLGVDLGMGVKSGSSALAFTYDFVQRSPVISFGVVP